MAAFMKLARSPDTPTASSKHFTVQKRMGRRKQTVRFKFYSTLKIR